MNDMEWAYTQAVKVQQELEAKYVGDLSQMSKYDLFTYENSKKFIEECKQDPTLNINPK